MKLKKYIKNLKIKDNKVICYNSHIANIENNTLFVLEKYKNYSITTVRYYRYVANELNINIVFVPEFK